MSSGARGGNGVWICDPAFKGLEPLDLFHKQLEPKPRPPHPEELKNRRMLLRKSFLLEDALESPFIDVSADDSYKLYVNGVFVAEGPASSWPFRYRFDRVPLDGLLGRGRNLIAVDVFYQGLVNRVCVSGDLRQGLFAELGSASGVLFGSDSTWRMLVPPRVPGSVFGYETQFSEDIDARVWPQDWQLPGFDESSWGFPCEAPEDGHRLVRSEMPALSRVEALPASVSELSPGRLLLDFGREIVGYFSCEAYGLSGDVVEIRHGEELDEASGCVRAMRCNCSYLDRWTLSGRQPDKLEYCDYKAFRYVELSVPPGARVEGLKALVRHYPLKPGSWSFESSSPLLKGIWDICANAVEQSSQSSFLDCPSREKGQYLGDLTVTAHSQLLLSGDARLLRKALQDFADSAFICPGLMAVAPSGFMQEIADYSLQYPLQLLLYARQSGDLAFVESLMPVAEGLMERFRKSERPDGLLENVSDKWNLVDWPDNLRDGYDFDLNPNGCGRGPHAVLNAFYASALQSMDELRALFGMPLKGGQARLKDSFAKAFFREGTGLFADSEASAHSSLHSNALALFAGLAPEEAVDGIASFIARKGFSCGVYMSYFVLKALARAGRHGELCALMLNEGPRSWANMLREGASACFEAWGKDQKWNTSLCHPWASAPIPVIVEELCGLRPAAPGWRSVSVSPRIPEGTPEFRLSLRLPSASLSLSSQGGVLELEACSSGSSETPFDVKPASGAPFKALLRAGEPLRLSIAAR